MQIHVENKTSDHFGSKNKVTGTLLHDSKIYESSNLYIMIVIKSLLFSNYARSIINYFFPQNSDYPNFLISLIKWFYLSFSTS